MRGANTALGIASFVSMSKTWIETVDMDCSVFARRHLPDLDKTFCGRASGPPDYITNSAQPPIQL